MTRVVSKGFLISTIAIPAVFGGIIMFLAWTARGSPAHTFTIAVADETGTLGRAISQTLEQLKSRSGHAQFDVTEVLHPPQLDAGSRTELNALVRARKLDGYLWIPRGIMNGAEPELVEDNTSAMGPGAPRSTLQAAGHARSVESDIGTTVNNSLMAIRLRRYGVRAGEVETLLQPITLRVAQLSGRRRPANEGSGYIVAIVMASILYGALLMYGITTMRSVLEEKTTRTMEVLISSVRPFQLMAGKILGVAAVGLTQFLIWAVSAGVIAAYGVSMAHAFGPGKATLGIHIPVGLLACFVIFFMGGYFLFASMYAAIGAIVSDQGDAQQIQMPVTFLLVTSFFLFGIVARDPNSSTSVILTLIPFFSPILMVFRIGLETPPLWQIALSIGILLFTTVAVVYASARIYRVGVLMYGKRPSVMEILRWMRYS
ncbi:MAG: ABC transporter permease [Terriglobia bacterium]